MRKQLVVFFIILITISVYALNCQYTTNNPYQEEVMNLYTKDTNLKLEFKELRVANFLKYTANMTPYFTFEVHNDNDYDINFEVSYLTCQGGCYTKNTTRKIYVVNARDFITENTGVCIRCNGFQLLENTIEFKVLESNYYEKRFENETFDNFSCKKCGDSNCLNDGQICSLNIQCGGGFCVEGICNNKNEFYNGINPCSENEIACNNNQCIQKGSVQLGFKPICSEQECIHGYVASNGLCAKTIDILNAEALELNKENAKEFQNNLFFGITALIIILIVIIIGYLYFKKEKTNEIKARTEEIIQKQKLISKEIEKRNYEISLMEQEIKELESRKKLKENELKKLDDLKDKFNYEKTKLTNYISSEWERINKPFPYELARNKLVIINPYLGGYYCFYQEELELQDYPKSSLVHRWIWKEANGRWPKPGHHIHHKDGKKYNNSPENLEEISGEEHFNLHRNN